MNLVVGYIAESGKLASASSILRAIAGVTSPDLICENCLQKKMNISLAKEALDSLS